MITEHQPTSLQKDLEFIINKHSQESVCANTPDFILAAYIKDCLATYATAVNARDKWYGSGGGLVPRKPLAVVPDCIDQAEYHSNV